MMRLILRVRGVVRRIGNSPGLIIPGEEVQKHKVKEGDVVELEVERRVNLREMFGAFEFSKSSQEMKDEARAEWGDFQHQTHFSVLRKYGNTFEPTTSIYLS